jgi:hypothetical protein
MEVLQGRPVSSNSSNAPVLQGNIRPNYVQGKVIDVVYAAKPRSEFKKLWDNHVVIGEVRKSDRVKTVIAASIRDGVKYINLRDFYQRQSDMEWRPAKDGMVISLVYPINNGQTLLEPYKDFITLIAEAAKVLQDMPLYDENNVVMVKRKERTVKRNED